MQNAIQGLVSPISVKIYQNNFKNYSKIMSQVSRNEIKTEKIYKGIIVMRKLSQIFLTVQKTFVFIQFKLFKYVESEKRKYTH